MVMSRKASPNEKATASDIKRTAGEKSSIIRGRTHEARSNCLAFVSFSCLIVADAANFLAFRCSRTLAKVSRMNKRVINATVPCYDWSDSSQTAPR